MQLELLGVRMIISNNDRVKKVKKLLGLSGNKESEDTLLWAHKRLQARYEARKIYG